MNEMGVTLDYSLKVVRLLVTRDVVVKGWREASIQGSGGRRRPRILTFGFMIIKYKMDTVLVSADITCLDTGG
jgi:hypothetical protein